MELISVIIPAYNAEKTIYKCLRSIMGGGYFNIEVIVINDGSTDRTEEIVKNITKDDRRVRLITQTNAGVAEARNTGLRNAKGKYIAWCDADDWVESTWLEDLHRYLTEYEADIAVCRCQIDNRPIINRC